jgi:hypothetical protein
MKVIVFGSPRTDVQNKAILIKCLFGRLEKQG